MCERIERGDAIDAQMFVADNIIGWGEPFSTTFSLMAEEELTPFQEQWNDLVAQGVGEELADMGTEALRAAMGAYLDNGPDFIKYGGSAHFRQPVLIGFSPGAQCVIVEEAHKRGKKSKPTPPARTLCGSPSMPGSTSFSTRRS
ncbi:hypothetical protein [Amphiplicatus metriothermophilus]|uniref:hypothetical protein n=1 Tax=Amphiplicatus metriothermophilus TaxID=1519374 RepID=UPI0018418E25|nr:hypothetical protein [Amphiplicatus metriothermophilus]MBB5518396.1 hypothetical protein [Amphiplicatus metriothermophilus]